MRSAARDQHRDPDADSSTADKTAGGQDSQDIDRTCREREGGYYTAVQSVTTGRRDRRRWESQRAAEAVQKQQSFRGEILLCRARREPKWWPRVQPKLDTAFTGERNGEIDSTDRQSTSLLCRLHQYLRRDNLEQTEVLRQVPITNRVQHSTPQVCAPSRGRILTLAVPGLAADTDLSAVATCQANIADRAAVQWAVKRIPDPRRPSNSPENRLLKRVLRS